MDRDVVLFFEKIKYFEKFFKSYYIWDKMSILKKNFKL